MGKDSLTRFNISLSVSGEQAENISERCSRLFYRELKTLLARELTREIPAGLSVTLPTPLVLDLGVIPLATFERGFCHRLEAGLAPLLRQQLMALSAQWQWESWEQSWQRLSEAQHSRDEPLEEWLLLQLANGPSHWWPVLAGYVLRAEGAQLTSQLQQETLRSLCQQLATGIDVDQALTEHTLWLSALRYFQCHPSLNMPDPPCSWQGSMPSLMALGGGDMALLCALFAAPPSSTSAPESSLTAWLCELWAMPPLRAQVAPMLASAHVGYWNAVCDLVVMDMQSHRFEEASNLPPQIQLASLPMPDEMGQGCQTSSLAVTPHGGQAGLSSSSSSSSSRRREERDVWDHGGPPQAKAARPEHQGRSSSALAVTVTPHGGADAITRGRALDRGPGNPAVSAEGVRLSSPASLRQEARDLWAHDGPPQAKATRPEVMHPGGSSSALAVTPHDGGTLTGAGSSQRREDTLRPSGDGTTRLSPLSQRELYRTLPAQSGEGESGGLPGRRSPARITRHLRGRSLQLSGRNGGLSELLAINQAGMALFWPLLPGLFRKLGLLDGKYFIDQQAQQLAAGCLDWLASAVETSQQQPTLSGILCGLTVRDIDIKRSPDENMVKELKDWLTYMPHLLPASWQRMSIGDMQQWFLLRTGWLCFTPSRVDVYIKPDLFDVLLHDWPWPTDLIVLPWLDNPIFLRWEDPLSI